MRMQVGTIPQWICAVAATVIAVVEVTQWQGFTPAWVTAVATSVLALAATGGLAGVLVPLQLERVRTRAVHLEKIYAVVLAPIQEALTTQYAPVVSRLASPLSWRSQGLFISDTIVNPAFPSLPGVDPSKVNTADQPLHEKLYTDTKEHHYPQLLANWESFQKAYTSFTESGLLLFAKGVEQQLKDECALPAISPRDPQERRRGCLYSALACHVFHRVWVTNYLGCLSVQSAPQDGPGSCKLWTSYGGEEYAYGSEAEMTKLRKQVEELIGRLDIAKHTEAAEELNHKLKALQDEIASIQANGILQGDCEATKGSVRAPSPRT